MSIVIKKESGLTLIEIILVIVIISVMFFIVGYGTGTFKYWKEDTFIQELRETLSFLHTQAVGDQSIYRLNFTEHGYRVGVLRPEEDISSINPDLCSQDVGALSCELAFFLSPGSNKNYTIIPPPSFPSLFDEKTMPFGMTLKKILAPTSDPSDSLKSVDFSPDGINQSLIILLETDRGQVFTISLNPLTGATTLSSKEEIPPWVH